MSKLYNFLINNFNYKRIVSKRIVRASRLYQKGSIFKLYARIAHQIHRRRYPCEIPPVVKIGENFYMPHCTGVVIGRTAIIGDNVTIFPNVVIGAKYSIGVERQEGRKHAIIGNNCMIGANAVVLGDIIVGNNVTIAAGAIVDKNVPNDSLVYGYNIIKSKKGNN